MIQVLLNGRLGNQMFQYAFALATARKLGVKLQLLKGQDEYELENFFGISSNPGGQKANALQKWVFNKRLKLGMIRVINEDQDELLALLSNNTRYEGYFQNEDYFLPADEILKSAFNLTRKNRAAYEKTDTANRFSDAIIIHVRLKDFISWGNAALGGFDLSLPASYYSNALKAIGADENDKIIIVSDDPELARERLSFLPNASAVDYSAVVVFQIMLHARRLIISNSTFAWWAAWLNPHQPQIVAPQYWLGFKVGKEYPAGIMSKKFTAVSVY